MKLIEKLTRAFKPASARLKEPVVLSSVEHLVEGDRIQVETYGRVYTATVADNDAHSIIVTRDGEDYVYTHPFVRSAIERGTAVVKLLS